MFPKEFSSSWHVPQRVLKFLACSPKSSQVLGMFPKEFSITPHFYPICFGKCYPPFTYIGGQKGGALYFKLEPSILGNLHRFFFFPEWWANQINPFEKNKFKWTWKAPYLMNRREEMNGFISSHLLAFPIGRRSCIDVRFGYQSLAWTLFRWHLKYFVCIWWMGMLHRSAYI
jgi:hypothetical protein